MVNARHMVPTEPTRAPLSPQAVRRALAHMRANLPDKITLADLAAACGTSERALLKQFERFVGASPMTHLLRVRLAAARTELLRPDSTLSIADVACGCGLPHLGRFAAEYRKAFGELPSTTVRRAREVPERAVADEPRSVPVPFVARPRPSLTVLPLRTETVTERRAAQELTEQLAANLSQASLVHVTFADPATTVVRQLARAPRPDPAAQYCLQGRLVQRDERTRITFWLTDAAGRHVWGDSYDGSTSALFDLMRHVVDGALCGIVPAITGAEITRLSEKSPNSLAARELLLRAFPLFMKLDAQNATRALAIATRAMELDPDDALPPAFAAYCHLRLLTDGAATSPFAARAETLRLAQRAATLDLGDPLVTTARAAIATLLQPREEAEALVERASAMDPTSAWAWERKGFLYHRDSPNLALACFDRALRLYGPRMPTENCLIGISQVHCFQAHLEQGARFARLALAENPRAMLGHRLLIGYEQCLGRPSAARQSALALRQAHPLFRAGEFMQIFPGSIPDALIVAGVPL